MPLTGSHTSESLEQAGDKTAGAKRVASRHLNKIENGADGELVVRRQFSMSAKIAYIRIIVDNIDSM